MAVLGRGERAYRLLLGVAHVLPQVDRDRKLVAVVDLDVGVAVEIVLEPEIAMFERVPA